MNDLDPGDGSLIGAALNDIARAYGVTRLAPETGLRRVGIYKAPAPNRRTAFPTLVRIARALGLRLRITMQRPRTRWRVAGRIRRLGLPAGCRPSMSPRPFATRSTHSVARGHHAAFSRSASAVVSARRFAAQASRSDRR